MVFPGQYTLGIFTSHPQTINQMSFESINYQFHHICLQTIKMHQYSPSSKISRLKYIENRLRDIISMVESYDRRNIDEF